MSEDLHQGTPSAVDTAPEPAAPPSIADIASRAIEVANQRASDREAGKAVPDALPSVAPDRARDEAGKFAPKPKPSTKEPASTAAPAANPAALNAEPSPQPEATPAAAPAALQPNPRWSDADKANFARLPPDAQKSILDMAGRQEADYTRKTQELAEQRKHVEPFAGALQEHGQFLQTMSQQIRQPPARIVGDVLQAYRQLTTGAPHERAQTLAFMAQVAGVDLRSLAQQPQGQVQGQQPQIDPAIARELQQLRQQVAGFGQFQQAVQQDREQQSLQTAQQQIDGFANAKDEHGQPKYPHFEAVRGFMAPHVQAGRTFEEAYTLAAKPITDVITAREQAAAEEKASSEAQARTAAETAEKARAASVARARGAAGPRPTGSRPGMTQSKDLSDITWDAMRKAGMPV